MTIPNLRLSHAVRITIAKWLHSDDECDPLKDPFIGELMEKLEPLLTSADNMCMTDHCEPQHARYQDARATFIASAGSGP